MAHPPRQVAGRSIAAATENTNAEQRNEPAGRPRHRRGAPHRRRRSRGGCTRPGTMSRCTARRSRTRARCAVAELEAARARRARSRSRPILAMSTRCPISSTRRVERFGRLDALVNNASAFYPTPIGTATAAQWDELFGTNARAPFFLAQAAAPHLAACERRDRQHRRYLRRAAARGASALQHEQGRARGDDEGARARSRAGCARQRRRAGRDPLARCRQERSGAAGGDRAHAAQAHRHRRTTSRARCYGCSMRRS